MNRMLSLLTSVILVVTHMIIFLFFLSSCVCSSCLVHFPLLTDDLLSICHMSFYCVVLDDKRLYLNETITVT